VEPLSFSFRHGGTIIRWGLHGYGAYGQNSSRLNVTTRLCKSGRIEQSKFSNIDNGVLGESAGYMAKLCIVIGNARMQCAQMYPDADATLNERSSIRMS